ncbi:hypothetical protein KIN20_022991 [Parelaphostrongylus tenuis]|uniref:Uncharacterized protein n=1 Tax=Parelaphostrongylus tenuis TaxID=148309 RepID=A0AAD5N9P1_PARTN|nr:hypothetical protein KIN20_022991 [Parelaphostrongylus tenuis]
MGAVARQAPVAATLQTPSFLEIDLDASNQMVLLDSGSDRNRLSNDIDLDASNQMVQLDSGSD